MDAPDRAHARRGKVRPRRTHREKRHATVVRNEGALVATEPLRIAFYKATASFVRAYGAVASDLAAPGYDAAKIASLKAEVEYYAGVRGAIKKHSREELDIKPYEADMRHSLNSYVQADPATSLGELGARSLVELIVETGIHDVIARQINAKGNLSKNAVAETIISNVRKVITRDQLTDPRFYDQMSALLDDLIRQSREDTVAYEAFLRQAEALAKRLAVNRSDDGVPGCLHGNAEASVLFNNLPTLPATTFRYPTPEEALAQFALRLDRTVREQAPAGWRALRYVERESHYLSGRRYLLSVVEGEGRPSVALDHRRIRLNVRPGSSAEQRSAVLHAWHRSLLHQVVPTLIAKWEQRLGVRVSR